MGEAAAHLSSKIKVGVIGEVDGSGLVGLGLIFDSQRICLKQQPTFIAFKALDWLGHIDSEPAWFCLDVY